MNIPTETTIIKNFKNLALILLLLFFLLCNCSVIHTVHAFQTLQQQFNEFKRDTTNTGDERVAEANRISDSLISSNHIDSETIADWKDRINEAWADLKELMETRVQVQPNKLS